MKKKTNFQTAISECINNRPNQATVQSEMKLLQKVKTMTKEILPIFMYYNFNSPSGIFLFVSLLLLSPDPEKSMPPIAPKTCPISIL